MYVILKWKNDVLLYYSSSSDTAAVIEDRSFRDAGKLFPARHRLRALLTGYSTSASKKISLNKSFPHW